VAATDLVKNKKQQEKAVKTNIPQEVLVSMSKLPNRAPLLMNFLETMPKLTAGIPGQETGATTRLTSTSTNDILDYDSD
jgi:hypothetical protein